MEREVEISRANGAGPTHNVARDMDYMRILIVNVIFVGTPEAGDRSWVLVDTGLAASTERIVRAAEARFGRGARPAAIILTHGHFDHTGAASDLADRWNVPIYAHEMEMPYLTGRSPYPPPDPTVGGGAMAALSRFYRRAPIDLGSRVLTLPADGAVPGMPGWRWIPTPGHSPGHISLFRDADRALIAGDAFVTVKQESALAVLTQRPEIHGPPAYFTPDWQQARESVERLAALEPSVAATGHGVPMRGDALRRGLQRLARDFERLAVPRRGRYVREPAITNEEGIVSVPPPVSDPLPKVATGIAAAALVGMAASALLKRRDAER
jgi:glyoxylase-like metal-dependent hydrolase (beta-lactamase superfamily II)